MKMRAWRRSSSKKLTPITTLPITAGWRINSNPFHKFLIPFRYNDDSILIGKTASPSPSTSTSTAKEVPEVEKSKPIDISESSDDEAGVSSDADSDFIDVPEMDSDENDRAFFIRSQRPLPAPFLMNKPPDNQEFVDVKLTDLKPSNGQQIEVVINPGQLSHIQDDIFADIFNAPNDKSVEDTKQENDFEICDKTEAKSETTEIIDLDTPEKDRKVEEPTVEFTGSASISKRPIEVTSNKKILNILSGLDDEKSLISKLSLDDLLVSKPNSNVEKKTTEDTQDLDKEKPAGGFRTPTKIPQPFFVNKTPPSSKKKSPAKSDSELTPSKAVKSLTEAFECLPSTSTQAERVTGQDTMAMAAQVLRDKKSKEELEDIAEQLGQERRDLAAERNKKDRLGVSITEQMSMECMDLLRLFGVPYVVAPMEAEAQCAFLNEINLTDGTITDDSDIWLFGGQTVYKNFFDQNKHVLEFRAENIERLYHLDRQKLIQLSFLVGSDYTEGSY